MFYKITQSLIDFLFPEKCLGCDKKGLSLCKNCLSQTHLSLYKNEDIYAIFSYKNILIKKIIKNLKYKRKKSALEKLIYSNSNIFEKIIKENISKPKQEIILIPIPQHKKKQTIKGYNQSEIIAKQISKIFNIEIKKILIKTKNTKSQVETKSKIERLQNISNSMDIKKSINKDFLYIIIDDVYTTGATINEAKRVLKKHGAQKVIAITLAHKKF